MLKNMCYHHKGIVGFKRLTSPRHPSGSNRLLAGTRHTAPLLVESLLFSTLHSSSSPRPLSSSAGVLISISVILRAIADGHTTKDNPSLSGVCFCFRIIVDTGRLYEAGDARHCLARSDGGGFLCSPFVAGELSNWIRRPFVSASLCEATITRIRSELFSGETENTSSPLPGGALSARSDSPESSPKRKDEEVSADVFINVFIYLLTVEFFYFHFFLSQYLLTT